MTSGSRCQRLREREAVERVGERLGRLGRESATRWIGLRRGKKKKMARAAQWLLLLVAGLKENGLQLGW
jgi:hypothetical protein